MSNKRQDEDREVALHAYILEHHPDYAGWLKRRNAHRREMWQEAERRYPQKRATPEMLGNRPLSDTAERRTALREPARGAEPCARAPADVAMIITSF
jgi:hypothetical protein